MEPNQTSTTANCRKKVDAEFVKGFLKHMNKIIEKKEIKIYEKEIKIAVRYGESLVIKDSATYELALVEGKRIKDRLNEITARKEEITKPINIALKSVRDLFRPIETAGEEAVKTIKDKMLEYTKERAEKAEEIKLKLAARVERGTMRIDTAVRKIGEVETPEKTVMTAEGKATTVSRRAWRVTDKSKIPLEFMEPDMVKIKASFRSGKPVPGVEEYEEQDLKFGN